MNRKRKGIIIVAITLVIVIVAGITAFAIGRNIHTKTNLAHIYLLNLYIFNNCLSKNTYSS